MITRILIPILALAGLAFAVGKVVAGYRTTVVPPPVVEPARAPFEQEIAASGIVEPSTEAIAVSAAVGGLVLEVVARPGDAVAAETPLFRVDGRDLEAELVVARADAEAAQARLRRLADWPRDEDTRAIEARRRAAAAELEDARLQDERARAVKDERALSSEERNRRRLAFEAAQARDAEAEAELARYREGSWEPDLAVARAEETAALARIRALEIELERRVVRAPCDATVLQVNVRPGEYAVAGPLARPLMVLGDTRVLHVRADIDEHEAWRFREGSRARAFVRGNRDLATDLEFVRIEPYVVPKRSLTGESTERVDTRVLQVIYRFDPAGLRAHVGQQVDVFVEVEGGGTEPAGR
jgi:multidrug resistance efflux pump